MEFIESEVKDTEISKNVELSTTGKILIGITGGVALGLTILCAPFVSPALRKFCLPYIPATHEQVRNIFTALQSRTGTLVDLGSGDGRIVIDAAKRGYSAHGVELNPWLVLYSTLTALKHGETARTKFFCKDLWKFNLKPYDNVVIFGVEQMMADLEKKILVECRQDCTIVACRFKLPTLVPSRTVGSGIDTVWVYTLPTT
ncbi:uncharacterized protein CBL_02184 [Carabus blaptoides fortunei]